MSRELFERKCREHGGELVGANLCKLEIEGIEWPFYEGIGISADYRLLHATIYLPMTPSYRLSKRGWRIFEEKARSAGLSYSMPMKSLGTYYASIYADVRDFDKLVQALRDIGREFKTLFGD
jgi:hypothetical protein